MLDGSFFIFVRFRDGRWRVDDPVPVGPHSTETFLHYLLSLSTEKAVTPENLVRDFGENSNTARAVVPALYLALAANDNPKVGTLFRQWRRQFQEVTGYDASGGQLDARALAKSYAVKDPDPDIERLFFAIHTYYAIFIKLLALQVAHYYLMPKVGTGLAAAANYDPDRLCGYLARMERGGLLAELGIRNFLEGDFFGWYLDVWSEPIEGALRRLIGDLADYSLVTLDVDPEETRDLLKRLYQNLMPRKLRHALGEYYTPDWLAERLLNQLGYDGNPKWRLLDPACGSGTFLVLAIKRVRAYAAEKGLNEADVLEAILRNIVGFDLNPLAVSSARTNYLLALGDLLQHRRGEISIPVYLADSILTPSQGADLFGQHGYSFNTAVGKFTVPRGLVDARYIDPLADLLEECVTSGLTADQFRRRLLRTLTPGPSPSQGEGGGGEGWDPVELDVAVSLYEQLADLERQGINGIWARIIKNAFAPLFQGRFDFVAGNPPWVNWESLPAEYRQETAPLWLTHNLFAHKGFDAILGKAKDDISTLLTYVALDNYLKDEGRLGFVITQSVFKTAGGGQGFRRFQLGNGTPVGVVAVDDMVDLQPFEGASNRTAVVILQRGRATRYPVPYYLWRKTALGKRISEDASLEEVLSMCSTRQFVAQPIERKDPTSSWISGRSRSLAAVAKILGPSAYKGRKGITASVNGVFWLQKIASRPDGLVVFSNLTERAKRDVENIQSAIEPDLVYPLLRGQDVKRWSAAPSVHILVPHLPTAGLKAIPESQMAVEWPKAYSYLRRFESLLRQSGIYRRYFKPGDPFYSVFNVGEYTFSPYKVVFREIADEMICAVVTPLGERPVVPDHKLVLCPCMAEGEAHFICAMLNSAPARFVVNSYSIETQFSTHVFDYVRVPKYNPANPTHIALADLSQQAHAATAAGDPSTGLRAGAARVQQIEAEIDRLAAGLWGLTDAELKEIQESLAELG